jgi:hypothetical protein
MNKLKKTVFNVNNPMSYSRKREYDALSLQFKKMPLADYEDATVFARTILDSASDEDVGHISSRPHIFMVISRGGRVQITKEDNRAKCTVHLRRSYKQRWKITSGTCDFYDPNGVIYAAATDAVQHISKMIEDNKQ